MSNVKNEMSDLQSQVVSELQKVKENRVKDELRSLITKKLEKETKLKNNQKDLDEVEAELAKITAMSVDDAYESITKDGNCISTDSSGWYLTSTPSMTYKA